MPTAIVTGCGGLIGSEAVRQLIESGYRVVGIDNDMRSYFFGEEASTRRITEELSSNYGSDFIRSDLDIRDADALDRVFLSWAGQPEVVIHTAAQPSHDWAAREPRTDFGVNAVGTLNVLEATRHHAPDGCAFIHCSTSKVYGDTPNRLPLRLDGPATRYDLPRSHPFYHGITPDMSIDQSLHSLFGASKLAGDVLVQEYGRYFGMPTVCFRPGCLTGPAHQGAELHGFLAYLMKCCVTGHPYTVFGYDGYQVRDNIHATDLVSAFMQFVKRPTVAAVYNLGGGRANSCSMREAISLCQGISGRELQVSFSDDARIGDHMWWIGAEADFRTDYPLWERQYDLRRTLKEIFEFNADRWEAERA